MADSSTDDEDDDDDLDLTEEFLQHELMNQTCAYIERGRRLQMLSDPDVARAWVVAFERWFDKKTAENCRDMDDGCCRSQTSGDRYALYQEAKEGGIRVAS